MYITSQELINDIKSTAERIELAFGGLLKFNEYIAIPCYGTNIILRFSYIGNDNINLQELDELEESLRKTVGERYFANLMGTVYQKQGLNYDNLKPTTQKIDSLVDMEITTNYFHKTGLNNDCVQIKTLFNLIETPNIWEIQVNTDEILILALCSGEKPLQDNELKGIDGESRKIKLVFVEDDNSYRGLMKTVMLAISQKVSMCHVLLDYDNNYEPDEGRDHRYE